MSEEFKTHIFEAFTRERTSTVSGIQGTGLGMSITKSIVDKMGRTIRGQSESGKGSEFIVDLKFHVSGETVKFEPIPEIQGLRALVADDDADTYMSISSMLHTMPHMDGYEATRQIHASDDPKKSAIPIIAMTANAFEEDKQAAFEAGMCGHIAKPINFPVLLEMLEKILK